MCADPLTHTSVYIIMITSEGKMLMKNIQKYYWLLKSNLQHG